jgi:hypothetical protein
MDTPHRYTLEKSSKKHVCPDCTKKTFVRYIDTHTGEYLPPNYGRCDRESKCLYIMNPYKDGYAKAIQEQERGNYAAKPNNWTPQRAVAPPQPEQPVFFDLNTFKRTLEPQRYESNIFIQNLLQNVKYPFNVDEVTKVVQLYRLGTVASGYRAGAITFPFIDIKGNIRAVQVKQFDTANHTTATDFLHSIIEKHYTRSNTQLPDWLHAYRRQDKRVSCLFGEHLLSKYPNNPVALVEAPKTAVYCTLYFGAPTTPTALIWLAVYNKSSFSFDKVKALKGRFVYVFPDLSKDRQTYVEWQLKAKDFEKRLTGTRFIFSDLLEQLAPENDKENGKDLADYLINQDWKHYRGRLIQDAPMLQKSVESEDSEALKTSIFLEYEPHQIDNENRLTEIRKRIDANRKRIEDYNAEIDYNERSIRDMEATFTQASKGCSVKWYAPRFINEPKEFEKLKALIYWTT